MLLAIWQQIKQCNNIANAALIFYQTIWQWTKNKRFVFHQLLHIDLHALSKSKFIIEVGIVSSLFYLYFGYDISDFFYCSYIYVNIYISSFTWFANLSLSLSSWISTCTLPCAKGCEIARKN